LADTVGPTDPDTVPSAPVIGSLAPRVDAPKVDSLLGPPDDSGDFDDSDDFDDSGDFDDFDDFDDCDACIDSDCVDADCLFFCELCQGGF